MTAPTSPENHLPLPPAPRVLLAKSDALGDQLFAVAMLRGLRERIQPALVVWMVRASNVALSALLPGSRVFRPEPGRPPGNEAARLGAEAAAKSAPGPWKGVVLVPLDIDPYNLNRAELPSSLARFGYWRQFAAALQVDLAIAGTLCLNWLDQGLVAGSRAPRRAGTLNDIGPHLLDWFSWRQLGLSAEDLAFTHAIPHAEQDQEQPAFEALLETVCGGGPIRTHFAFPLEERAAFRESDGVSGEIVIAPGSSTAERNWPSEHFAELALALEDLAQAPVALLRGPADEAIFARIGERLALAGRQVRVHDMSAGDLPQTARIIAGARLLVGSDSFPRHLAAALGVPAVVIMGGGHPARFIARDASVTLLYQPLECMPCQWCCCFERVRCVKDIPLETVLDTVKEQLVKPVEGVVWKEAPAMTSSGEIQAALRRRDTWKNAILSAKEREIAALTGTCKERMEEIEKLRAQLIAAKEKHRQEKDLWRKAAR